MLSNKKLVAYAIEGLKESIEFNKSALGQMRENFYSKNVINKLEETIDEMEQDYYELTGEKWED